MCGIAGLVNYHSQVSLPSTLSSMAEQLRHRGPDNNGIWADEANHVGFTHTRLAILDVSSAGCQPMVSNSGRYVIVFNGEIYNHRAIRLELNSQRKRNWYPNY